MPTNKTNKTYKTYQNGDKIKLKPEHMDEGDEFIPITVVEDRGDRLLVIHHNGIRILPSSVILKEWIEQ